MITALTFLTNILWVIQQLPWEVDKTGVGDRYIAPFRLVPNPTIWCSEVTKCPATRKRQQLVEIPTLWFRWPQEVVNNNHYPPQTHRGNNCTTGRSDLFIHAGISWNTIKLITVIKQIEIALNTNNQCTGNKL